MLAIVFLGLALAVTAMTALFLMTFVSVAFPGPDHSPTRTSITSTDSHACRCGNCQSASADHQKIARRAVVATGHEFTDQNLQHTQGGSP